MWAFSEPTKWILVQVFHAEQENCDETVLKIKFKKKIHAMQETRVQSLSWEVPLEKGMAIHSSIVA